MNSANDNTVRSALDCLPRCGFKSQQELLMQLRNQRFLFTIFIKRSGLVISVQKLETVSACRRLNHRVLLLAVQVQSQ